MPARCRTMGQGSQRVTESQTYGVDDFMRTFGAWESERRAIAEEAGAYDFRYRRLDQADRDRVILGVLEKLAQFTVVGEHRSDIWESCWSGAKKAFLEAKGDLNALDPEFMGSHPIIRLHGDYARPEDPKFETHWFRVMRRWLFTRFLTGASAVMEFGCGSGFNLAAAGQMFPGIALTGLDWSQSAVELADHIGQSQGFNLKGRRFDFFNPDNEVPVDSDTVVMTFAALEQTGPRCTIFAEWLLTRRPRLVLSMEPIVEFYDPASLFDLLAIRYHTHREYLKGYESWVRKQAAAGRVEIVASFRPGFGSLYHEGYSVLVWRPV